MAATVTVFVFGAVFLAVVVALVAVSHGLARYATCWVEPRCVRCGRWVQPAHRSRIDFDGCEWVCIQCVTER